MKNKFLTYGKSERIFTIQKHHKRMNTQVAQTGSANVARYEVGGTTIELTPEIVRDIIGRGKAVDDNQVIKFMHLCKFNRLNPFTNEVYLLPIGGKSQMVVSKEAYFKRADAHPQYDGFEAGVIVQRNGELLELFGMFYHPTDSLLGAWAKVYRKDRTHPTKVTVSFSEYQKKSEKPDKETLWDTKPATMITKVAKVQALREAFPTLVSGIYIEEELSDLRASDESIREGSAKAKAQPQTEAPINLDDIRAQLLATESVEELTKVFRSLSKTAQADRSVIQICREHKEALLKRAEEAEYTEYEEVPTENTRQDELSFA